jgi:phospholipase D1/2
MVDVSKSMAGGKPWATYDESSGNDVYLYHLATDNAPGTSGAFHDLEQAILQAQQFIFIADWSFQPDMRLRLGSPATVGNTVGCLLNERAKAGVLVAVHTWDHTNAAAADPQNDYGNSRLDAIARAFSPPARRRSDNLLWRASSRTGVGWSHHQKFVVLDAPGSGGKRRLIAFLGGLDLTRGRMEVSSYPVRVQDATEWKTQVTVNNTAYDEWYNAEFTRSGRSADPAKGVLAEDAQPGQLDMPRQPWEDYYARVIGPAAWDVTREFVGRWECDPSFGNTLGQNDDAAKNRVTNLFKSLFDNAGLVKPWEPHTGPFTARIVRSMARVHWGPRDANRPPEVTGKSGKQKELIWTVPGGFERSIQNSYVNSIQNAERFIFIENQYLIGSGARWNPARPSVANGVPEAIVNRISSKIRANQPFHTYVVVPMFPEGDPVSGASLVIRNFEWLTMRYMAQGVHAVSEPAGKDWRDYLSFYFVANWGPGPLTQTGSRRDRVKSNDRYMVYVHSKLMVIDDEFLILGSANLNERSLAGDRDSEIAMYLRPGSGKLDDCRAAIRELRRKAWNTLMGGLPSGWDAPETPGCVSDVRNRATNAYIQFRGRIPGTCRLVSFPFGRDANAFSVQPISNKSEDPYIPDDAVRVDGNGVWRRSNDWLWHSPNGSSGVIHGMDVGE